MPPPIIVTDEMRQAVYQADCDNNGHILAIENAIGNNLDVHPDKHIQTVMGPDTDTLPHLYCRRCGKVWLVIEDSGANYTEAVTKLTTRIQSKDTNVLVPSRKGKNSLHAPDSHTHP
jgi:hypothetical protein